MICPVRQQGKQTYTCITGNQIDERHRPGREQGLAPFFQSDNNGQEQADGQDNSRRIPLGEQDQGAFVQEKTQDSEQDEMSHLITAWKAVKPI